MIVKKGWIALGAVVLVLLFAYGGFKGTYNGFVQTQEEVNRTWADVESSYQRRADLIPNLVETVKAYASHEKEVLTSVTEARSRVGQMNVSAENLTPEAIQRFQQAQQGLSGALSRLLVVAERYPDLKANQNFRDLQVQLEGTENRINVARNRFNQAAREYNGRVRSFPASIVANVTGFQPKPYYQAEAGAAQAPKVKF
ncbi:MAG: LemA family protein [Deltaproteobacteria bacterium]|nr:LemA family protein [Deltaproteobacteria bacterium]